jgi:hypothetical protein
MDPLGINWIAQQIASRELIDSGYTQRLAEAAQRDDIRYIEKFFGTLGKELETRKANQDL